MTAGPVVVSPPHLRGMRRTTTTDPDTLREALDRAPAGLHVRDVGTAAPWLADDTGRAIWQAHDDDEQAVIELLAVLLPAATHLPDLMDALRDGTDPCAAHRRVRIAIEGVR